MMMKLPVTWLAACWSGLVLAQAADATDPPATPISAVSDVRTPSQPDRTRELIKKRAVQLARARAKRMAARKQAGISLLRPIRSMAAAGPERYYHIDRGIRLNR